MAFVRDTETLGNLITFPVPADSGLVNLNDDGTGLREKNKYDRGACEILNLNCATSRDGKWKAELNETDTMMRVTNVKTGMPAVPAKKWKKDSENVFRLALSDDGKLLAAANGIEIDIWKVDGWSKIGSFSHEWQIREMNFTSDGLWLTAVSERVSMDVAEPGETRLAGSTVMVWDIKDRRVANIFSLAKEGGIVDLSFTDNGRILVTTNWVYNDGENRSEGRMWILTPDDLINYGCSLLSRNLSNSEWDEFMQVKDPRRRRTCKGLRIPEE